MIINEHFGKIVNIQLGGVMLELILVEFPVRGWPNIARCIDRSNTRYQVPALRMKGTGRRVEPKEITKIAAAAVARWKKNAGGSPP